MKPEEHRPPKEAPYAYVKRAYGVDPVIGNRVKTSSGKEGVIVRKRSYDQYVYVKFDGTSFSVPCHPKDLVYQLGTANGPDGAQEPDAGGTKA